MTKTTKIRLLAAIVALALVAPAWAQATIEGSWTTRTRDNDDGRRWVQLSMELDDETGTWGWSVDADDLDGISFAQLDSDVDDARFELVRDAGTVVFEGVIRAGRGSGTFAFTPSAAWQREMAQMGYDDLSEKRVFSAAIHDITAAYVAGLQRLGYDDLDTSDLFSFVIHGVSVDFITEMNGLGYTDIAPRKLISMRIHGVTPEWVRQVRGAMGG